MREKFKEFITIFNAPIEETEKAKEQMLKNVYSFSVMLGSTLLIMSIMNINASDSMMVISTLFAAIICIASAAIGRRLKDRMLVAYGANLAVIIFFSYWVVSGGSGGFAIIWLLLIPFSGMISQGLRYGTFISLYFVVFLAVVFYTPLNVVIEGKYSELFMRRFPFVYFVAVVSSFVGVYRLQQGNIENERQKRELEELKIEADKANEAKSNFLASMSHEIRTPINAMLGMNELILRESNERKVIEYAANVENSGKILLSIVNDVLDLSKVESGKMTLVPVNYEVSNMINDVVNMLAPRVEDKGLGFRLDIDENIPRILNGDEIRIRQILMNLLTNSVKYTDKGIIELKTGYESIDVDKVRLIFSIADTGQGIKEDEMAHLFDSFIRVDETRNKHIEGTGLGLALTRTFAEMMGGTVEVKSVYGEGSVFTVSIIQNLIDVTPLGEAAKRIGEHSQVRKHRGTTIKANDAHILVVDDFDVNCEVFEGLLRGSDAYVAKAYSGEEAVELCKIEKYDIIFMDHMMPGMDGIEALKMIRQEGINKDTKVVVLTANAIIGTKEKYLEEGFDAFLGKPIMPAKLEALLLEMLPDKISQTPTTEDELMNYEGDEDEKTIIQIEQAVPGIDARGAIENYAGTVEFYKEMLAGYINNNRVALLCDAFEKEDLKEYRLNAHTLKGTSRAVGLDELTRTFEQLQLAAERGDLSFIKAYHDDMLEKVAKVTYAIGKIIQ